MIDYRNLLLPWTLVCCAGIMVAVGIQEGNLGAVGWASFVVGWSGHHTLILWHAVRHTRNGRA